IRMVVATTRARTGLMFPSDVLGAAEPHDRVALIRRLREPRVDAGEEARGRRERDAAAAHDLVALLLRPVGGGPLGDVAEQIVDARARPVLGMALDRLGRGPRLRLERGLVRIE